MNAAKWIRGGSRETTGAPPANRYEGSAVRVALLAAIDSAKRISAHVAAEECLDLTAVLLRLDAAGMNGEAAFLALRAELAAEGMELVRKINLAIDKAFGDQIEGEDIVAAIQAAFPDATFAANRTEPEPRSEPAKEPNRTPVDLDAFGMTPPPVQGGLL